MEKVLNEDEFIIENKTIDSNKNINKE